MFKFNPREMKKMMKRMGIEMDIEELSDAERVVIERSSGVRLLIDNPQVTIMRMKGQTIIQVVGEIKEEIQEMKEEEQVEIKQEDVELVALEAGVSLEEARQALLLTKGDLAQAILLLQSKRKT
ncbi:MAG: nascent polypeptide-associated complex protein [Fervidicoccaceae archaeon]|nr:nascent polypeptide-associated complex protein [Fervidicoccaceae archaeon]